jgi:hypothetical protein
MTRAEILNNLLDTYKFTRPIPVEVRRRIMKEKRRTLVAILKEKQKYSVFILLALYLYFLAKKLGISLPIAKVVMLTGVTAVTSAALVATGSYKLAQHIITHSSAIIQESPITMEAEKEKTEPDKIGTSHSAPAAVGNETVIIGLVPFDSLQGDDPVARKAAAILAGKLDELENTRGILMSPARRDYGAIRYLIFGSVVKSAGKYKIMVRLVDRETSQILANTYDEIGSVSEVGRACDKIIDGIRPHLR